MHELGHVQDDFARGVTAGFKPSQTPRLNDWPAICEYFGETTWAEFAAESVAADYLTPEIRADRERSDHEYLLGIQNRLQQSILMLRDGRADLAAVWSRAVTALCNIFSNLGRGSARYLLSVQGNALASFINPQNEAACWKPVIEGLLRELQALAAKAYEWGDDPFSGLKRIITQGFEAAGFVPAWDGENLRVNLR
jgi:hypothetical protein